VTWRTMTAIILGAAALAGCGQQAKTEAPAPAAGGGPKPLASIHELMLSVVDPAADEIWGSVATVSNASGVNEHRPRTDEDWAKVRNAAIALSEAANLLVMDGRVVAHPGQRIDSEGQPGAPTGAIIQKRIDGDRASFAAYAAGLQAASMEAVAAVEKKDVAALETVGGDIDVACEACHEQFWYPPTEPAKPKS